MHIGLTVSAYVGVRKGCPMTYSINTATTPGWLEMTTPVSDEAAHQDGRLMHELAVVNSQIGRYILRFLDVDAGHAESISTDAERAWPTGWRSWLRFYGAAPIGVEVSTASRSLSKVMLKARKLPNATHRRSSHELLSPACTRIDRGRKAAVGSD